MGCPQFLRCAWPRRTAPSSPGSKATSSSQCFSRALPNPWHLGLSPGIPCPCQPLVSLAAQHNAFVPTAQTASWTLSELSAALLSALSSGHYVATLLARSKGPPSNPRGLGVGGALGPGHKALSPGESRCACWGLLQGFGTYLLVVDVMEVRRAACEDCCWALAWIGDLKTHHRPGLPLHPGETRALTPASPSASPSQDTMLCPGILTRPPLHRLPS